MNTYFSLFVFKYVYALYFDASYILLLNQNVHANGDKLIGELKGLAHNWGQWRTLWTLKGCHFGLVKVEQPNTNLMNTKNWKGHDA
jgi:predicted transcriptional regulator with HTH domain